MFLIPGQIISLLTFPGVIVHEMAHRFFCDITKTPVYAVSYFRFGNPAGFVYHAPAQGIKKKALIALGPLFVNSLLCISISFTAVFPLYILDAQNTSFVFYFLQWLAFSIGMHAFPSNVDIDSLSSENVDWRDLGIPLSMILALVLTMLMAVNFLRFFWIDFFYALGLTLILPNLLI